MYKLVTCIRFRSVDHVGEPFNKGVCNAIMLDPFNGELQAAEIDHRAHGRQFAKSVQQHASQGFSLLALDRDAKFLIKVVDRHAGIDQTAAISQFAHWVSTSTLTDSNGIFRCWRLPSVGAVAGALSPCMTLGDDSHEVFATVNLHRELRHEHIDDIGTGQPLGVG